jgi:anti-sigma regulatory factor (Ser/Thr protein kinase)
MAIRAALPDVPYPPAQAGALRWRRAFPGHERELARVRRWLCSLLPGCPERGEFLIVATELGSNALEHTASGKPGGWFMVEVAWCQSVVVVAVADGGGPGEPRVVEELHGERGRGLLLVRGLSARAGWSGDERGRVVWAQIAWPDDAGVVPDASGDLGQLAAGQSPAALRWHGALDRGPARALQGTGFPGTGAQVRDLAPAMGHADGLACPCDRVCTTLPARSVTSDQVSAAAGAAGSGRCLGVARSLASVLGFPQGSGPSAALAVIPGGQR